MKGGKAKREIYHEAFKSTATFGALFGAQFMHTICRFEAWEVSNPILQTVRNSELK